MLSSEFDRTLPTKRPEHCGNGCVGHLKTRLELSKQHGYSSAVKQFVPPRQNDSTAVGHRYEPESGGRTAILKPSEMPRPQVIQEHRTARSRCSARVQMFVHNLGRSAANNLHQSTARCHE